MRDHSKHIELSRDEAVERLLAKLGLENPSASPAPTSADTREQGAIARQPHPSLRIEQAPLANAYGRVLARSISARTDVPNTLTCCMDSVAVHWSAFENLPEGSLPDTSGWIRGVDWEFANTGVAMPEGFDTAIVIEHVTLSEDEQRIAIDSAPSQRFAGTRAAGSQLKKDAVVAHAGAIITPDVAATIAAAGHSVVPVVAKPRVAFIPTGNELVPANLPFSCEAPEKYAGWGHVFESNSAVVKGKVEAWGGSFVPFDIVPDDYSAIKDAVEQAIEVTDIVILNAGSSKGSDDWSVEVLEEMGEMICHQTNHGPGHHSSMAVVKDVPVIGISGPSGGASFTLNFYLLPLMKAYLGQDPAPVRIPARLAAPFPANKFAKVVHKPTSAYAGETRPPEASKPGDVFFSVRFMTLEAAADGTLAATPVPGHAGSAPTQHANAFCLLPAGPGAAQPQPGDIIYVEMR